MTKAFIEIKNRTILLIVTVLSAFSAAYYYKIFILILVIVSNSKLSDNILNYFIFTSITELFLIYLTLCLSLTEQILYYITVYHIVCFFSSGLYRVEYNSLKFAFLLAILLGIISLYLFYEILIPILFDFFLGFQNNSFKIVNFYFEAKIYDYLTFYKDIYFSCFFNLQCCVVLLFLANYISNNLESLKALRKFLYLILLFFCTMITPPEVFSQIFSLISLITSFEILVLLNLFKKAFFNVNLAGN